MDSDLRLRVYSLSYNVQHRLTVAPTPSLRCLFKLAISQSGGFEQYTLSRLKVSSLSSPHGIGVSKGRLEGFVISAFRVQNASMSGFPGALTLTLLRAYSYLYLLFCPPLIYSHNVAIVILLKSPLTGPSTTHKIC